MAKIIIRSHEEIKAFIAQTEGWTEVEIVLTKQGYKALGVSPEGVYGVVSDYLAGNRILKAIENESLFLVKTEDGWCAGRFEGYESTEIQFTGETAVAIYEENRNIAKAPILSMAVCAAVLKIRGYDVEFQLDAID